MSLNKKELYQSQISSPADFKDCIAEIRKNLQPKTCILLQGELAVGKTTFVQKFCETYQLRAVASPTFSLHHLYENEKISIHHFDLYRLTNHQEIETSGLFETFQTSIGIVFIEWPSRISLADLPLDWFIYLVEIEKLAETSRHLKLSRLFG